MLPVDQNYDPQYIISDDTHEVTSILDPTCDQASDAELDEHILSDSGNSYHTMSTIQSREVADYFRSVYGYTFPSDDNVPLVFPADTTADRLDVLVHVIARLCLGGKNVTCEIDEMLRRGGIQADGTGPKVLDVVTNSGTWVNEMAGIYSMARFISLDSKPLVSHKPHARIQFQVYDFYAGIMEPDNAFDLVHMRQGVLATKNFNFLLQEIHRVLKPDGYIMITEHPFDVYEGISPRVLLRSTSYISQVIRFAYERCEIEGADTAAWKDMDARLDPGHPLWGNHQAGMNQAVGLDQKVPETRPVRGFHSIVSREDPVPLGNWPVDESQKVLGGLMRLWGYHRAQSSLPVVMRRGLDENQAREFMKKLLQDVVDVEQYQAYMMCRTWSARKI